MKVKSKIDLLFKILIWGTVLILLIAVISMSKNEKIISYVIGVPSIGFLLWIYFGTYYELRDTYLYCKSGPFFKKIYYDDIKSVKLSQNILSSLALSAKRIEIRYGENYFTGTIYISPEDREGFIKELEIRCKSIE